MTKLEEIALAIGLHYRDPKSPVKDKAAFISLFEGVARTAVAAMRKPNEAMNLAGSACEFEREHPESDCGVTVTYRVNEDAEVIYQTIIDAVLNEKTAATPKGAAAE